jgi:hypothetical protein
MRKFYLYQLAIFSLLCFSAAASAQPQHQSDTTLLSESIDGDYLVRRYKIERSGDEAQYTLHYSIDASRLNTLTASNADEMTQIEDFLDKLRRDTTINLSHIEIVGYASPDGSAAANEALALSRAQKFRALLDSRFALASDYMVKVRAEVEPWSACDKAVESSAIDNKPAVLQVLNSEASASVKEQQLKRMPQAWNILRTKILPPMRRVDMVAYYSTDAFVEVRTLINKPSREVAQAPKRACRCWAEVVDENIGIIIDMYPEGVNY